VAYDSGRLITWLQAGVDEMAMSLCIIFGRYDRDPPEHHYGAETDRVLDTAAGGAERLDRGARRPSAPIPGHPGRIFLHESGPVVEIDPDRIAEADTTLVVARDLARAWAARQVPSGHGQPWVDVRLGDIGDDPWPMGVRRFTTDPLTLVAELDEIIKFVVGTGDVGGG
jgi:hypothetical protein